MNLCQVSLLLVVGGWTAAADKTPLYFSYITTFTGDYISSGAIPIVDKALDQINSRTDILENYTLNYTTILDSKCSSTPALDSFLYHFKNRSQPTYITSMCCGCSTATIPIAEISHQWNIPQVTFSAADTLLKNRNRFKSLFRALPSFGYKAHAYAQLMREFGWKQMVMVYQKQSLFYKIKSSIETIYAAEDWNLLEIPLDPYLDAIPDGVFDRIAADNHRVIVLHCYVDYAKMFLCEAYKRGLRYPEYVFMLLGKFHEEWWKISDTLCTQDQLTEMINGSLSIGPEGNYLMENTSVTTTSGQQIGSFLEEYNKLLLNHEYSHYTETALVGVAYDAIWSIALGLDIAAKKIAAGNDSGCGHLPGDLVPLEQFDYYNQRLGCIMVQSMEEVTFTGVTREFKYINGGPVDNVYLVNQERTDNMTVHEVLVGKLTIINGTNDHLQFLPHESIASLWGSATPPYDGSPIETFIKNSIILEVVYYILSSIGLIFIACCTVFNIVFRNKKVIKLASPNLNYILLFGSALLYCCVYFYAYSVDSSYLNTYTAICNIQFLVFSLGYTACFAVILSKQWRVYYIFNNPTAKKKTIKDYILLIIIIVLVTIDLLIVLIDVAIAQTRIQAEITHHNQKYTKTEDGVIQENFIIICNNEAALIWLNISFLYKASLQVVAIFMAFHTRKVKIKALNDSKENTAIIYINSIILTLLAVTEFGFHAYNEAYATLFSLGLIVAASLFSGVTFIPKMVSLYLDPQGKRVLSTGITTHQKNIDQQFKQFHQSTIRKESIVNSSTNPDTMALNERTSADITPDSIPSQPPTQQDNRTSTENSSNNDVPLSSSIEEAVATGLP